MVSKDEQEVGKRGATVHPSLRVARYCPRLLAIVQGRSWCDVFIDGNVIMMEKQRRS